MSAAKTILTVLKYLFLVLFTLLLVGQLTALVLMQASQAVLLNPQFYKSELDKAGVYDYAYEKFDTEITKQGGPQAEALIELSGIALQDVITKSWLKTQAENLIDNGFAYINGQTQTADMQVDLTEPKTRLIEAAKAKIEQMPSLNNASSLLLTQLKAQLDEKVPDKIDLAAQAGGMQGLQQARTAVQTVKTATLGMAVFALVLAGLIAFLARKSLHSIARWLGVAFLAAGALSLAAISTAQNKASELLSFSAYVHTTPESQILTKIATDGLASIQQAAFPLAAALIILGTVGIAASFLIQTQKPAEKTEKEKN